MSSASGSIRLNMSLKPSREESKRSVPLFSSRLSDRQWRIGRGFTELDRQHHISHTGMPLIARGQAVSNSNSIRIAPATSCVSGDTDPLISRRLACEKKLLVRHPGGRHPSEIIANLARVHPATRIAVICSNRNAVGQHAMELKRLGLDASGYGRDQQNAGSTPQISVATSAGMIDAPQYEQCRIIVVTDPVNFMGPHGIGARMDPSLVEAMWLGLLSIERPISPLERRSLGRVFRPAF